MKRMIGTHELKNLREVYKVLNGYEVVRINRKGILQVIKIPEDAVDLLYSLCRGKIITADDAKEKIEPFAEELELSYHCGWKLGEVVRDILAILDVTDHLTISKEGNRFYYHLK